MSWYVYAGNNPVGWIDPSGLEDVPFNTVSGPLPLIDEVETGDQWYNTVFDTVAAGAAGIYNWGASAANMAINGLGGTAEKAQEFYEAADDATGGELSYLLEPAMLYLGTAEGMAAMAAFEEYLAAKTALNAGKAAAKAVSKTAVMGENSGTTVTALSPNIEVQFIQEARGGSIKPRGFVTTFNLEGLSPTEINYITAADFPAGTNLELVKARVPLSSLEKPMTGNRLFRFNVNSLIEGRTLNGINEFYAPIIPKQNVYQRTVLGEVLQNIP